MAISKAKPIDGGVSAQTPGARMPTGIKFALLSTLALLLTVAVYLAAVRGPAILLDLTGLARSFICF